MATFVPEWTGTLRGRDVKLRGWLSALDGAFVVRRPLPRASWAPDLFLQHPTRGWLSLAITDVPHDRLAQAQLFDRRDVGEFQQLLARLEEVEGPRAVLLWSCSRREARSLARRHRFAGWFVSRESLEDRGAALLARLLRPAAGPLPRFFPEAEIPAALAPRRLIKRDNDARLTLFLDPHQESAAKLDLELRPSELALAGDHAARLVNGVAGSGKTLIALKRAMILAEQFPAQDVLVLIHNTPVVADLRARVRRAYPRSGVRISTFYSWVREQWDRTFPEPPVVLGAREVAKIVEPWRGDLRLDSAQIADELDFINDTLIADEQHYLEANRAGRVFPLRGPERSAIWALHRRVQDELGPRQTWSGLPRRLFDSQWLARYDHIIVDEAQFFAPGWFELVRRCLKPPGRLFLCADPNQGFLRHRLSWKRAGLDVAGRTRKLRKAYRTTSALLRAASRVLGQPAGDDAEEFLQPDFSDMEPGQAPLLVAVRSPQDAVDRVVNEVRASVAAGLPLSDLLILYGDAVSKELLYDELARAMTAERVWWLNKPEHKHAPPSGDGSDCLRMSYLDAATGLEGEVVFLLGAERVIAGCERPRGTTAEELAAHRDTSRRKLYMAMTRAARRLVVLSSERPGPRVAAAFELGSD